MTDWERSLGELTAATRRLGRFLVERQPNVAYTYKDDGSILSELDESVQAELVDVIRRLPDQRLRDAHFVGEEKDAAGRTSWRLRPGELNWVVDAIDGTAAYTRGLNVFAISIGLLDGDFRPLFGLVHLPAMFNRSHIASAHAGPLMRYEAVETGDGITLAPLPPSPTSAALPPTDGDALRRSYIYAASNVHRQSLERFPGKVRNLGGTAAHLALLASGGLDPVAVLLSRVGPWDVAGGLALTEAAGMVLRRYPDWAPVSVADVFREAEGRRLSWPFLVGAPGALSTMRDSLAVSPR